MKRVVLAVSTLVVGAFLVGNLTSGSAAPEPTHYTATATDTYRIVAGKLGISESALACANRTSASSCPSVTALLGTGRIIHIPGVTPSTTTTTTTLSTSTTSVPATTTSSPASTSTTVPPSSTSTVPPSTSTTTVTTTTTTLPGPQAPIADNFTVTNELVADSPPGLNGAEGAFRTECSFSHLAYDDPIVFPGQPGASHLHAFFGNTGTNAASTYTSLRTTGESTCAGGKLNRTGYWTPAMIDGTDQVRVFETVTVYYKCSWNPTSQCPNFQEMPPGLRMIAGFNTADPTNVENPKHYKWFCTNPAGTLRVGTEQQTMPTCNIGEHLYVRMDFPNCWDGVNTDSTNHRDHMAFPTYPNGSLVCDAGHPIKLPTVTYQLHWIVTGSSTALWHLSSDTGTHGETWHADWYGGWSPPIMTTWMGQCVKPVSDCVFSQIGTYQGGPKRLREPVAYTGSKSLPIPIRG